MATSREHFVPDSMRAVAAVKVAVAIALAELATVTSKVVEPQPISTGAERLDNVKKGKTILMASPTARSTFNENATSIFVGAPVTGFKMVR